MSNPEKGGTYIIDENGKRVRIEGRNLDTDKAVKAAAPAKAVTDKPKPGKAATEPKKP